MKVPDAYSDVADIFGTYWHSYGGIKALISSPYLHLALVALILTANSWLHTKWWDSVIDVIPSLLGFTLGGFAIFIGFGDESFRSLMATVDDQDDEPSAYLSLCATFVHFVVIQGLALGVAIIASALSFHAEWMTRFEFVLPALNAAAGALGYGLFLYALTSVLAATMHLFRLAVLYTTYQNFNKQRNLPRDQSENNGR